MGGPLPKGTQSWEDLKKEAITRVQEEVSGVPSPPPTPHTQRNSQPTSSTLIFIYFIVVAVKKTLTIRNNTIRMQLETTSDFLKVLESSQYITVGTFLYIFLLPWCTPLHHSSRESHVSNPHYQSHLSTN